MSTRSRGCQRSVIGGFFLVMAGVHLGLATSSPHTYRPFADDALFGFVRSGWSEIFMSNPTIWGLLAMGGELAIGAALLAGGSWARTGYAAVLGFHLCLMLFGWGFWLWSVPVLLVVSPLALAEFHARQPRPHAPSTPTFPAAPPREI